MSDIEETDYGYRLTLAGTPDEREMGEFIEAMRSEAESAVGSFGVVADFRDLNVISEAATDEMEGLMEFCDRNGMTRSATIVDSATTKLQLSRLVESAGINDKIIDQSDAEDEIQAAIDWVEDGIEP